MNSEYPPVYSLISSYIEHRHCFIDENVGKNAWMSVI